jgi:hypothetical protein
LKKLLYSKKKVFAPLALPLKPPTYNNSAHLALAHSTQKLSLLGRVLKNVLVKVFEDLKPNQNSERLVESINTASFSEAGKVLDAQKLNSSNIVVTADSHETRNLIEYEEL